jgi:hypothetical protein
MDIHKLMDESNLTTAEELISVVEKFYPETQITPRVHFGIQQIAADFRKRADAVQKTPKPRRSRPKR